ncbi:hypothetical protein QIH04_27780, partial [Klebsiella pneumoniae]|nr:hypothetical protein [Klebsiella pneumoniae]
AALCRPAETSIARGGFALWGLAAVAALALIGLSFREGGTSGLFETNRIWLVAGVAFVMVVLAVLWKINRWQ